MSNQKTYTLTTTELMLLQHAAFTLGMNKTTEAMRLLYSEAKVQNTLGAMTHEGKELNDMLAGVLLLTPEGKSLLPRPHAE